MILKQLYIFVENKTGKLCEIAKIIASCNINLRAMCVADTSNFGILRFIVDNPLEVQAKLNDAGLNVGICNMVVVRIPDHPGSLAEILELLTKSDIGVEYLYAFLSAEQKNVAYVALRIESDKEQKALENLKSGGYTGSDIII